MLLWAEIEGMSPTSLEKIVESQNGLGWMGPPSLSNPTPAVGWLPLTTSGCPGVPWPWVPSGMRYLQLVWAAVTESGTR